MNYNQNELEAPEWVNSVFLAKVIECGRRVKRAQIQNYEVAPATAAGDHFSTVMFRVSVDFTADGISNGKISLIIKTPSFKDGYQKDAMNSSVDIFQSEIHIYTKVLPECREILQKGGFKDLLAPNVLYSSLEPNKVLVFEDLKDLGYTMLPRSVPNEHEVKLVFTKLAQYHAATFIRKADGRDDMEFKGTYFNHSFVLKLDFCKTGPKFLAELLETLPGFEKYAQKMRKLDFNLMVDKCSAIVHSPAPYSVLNHGDFHLRNIMFKTNELDAYSAVVLVDFQVPHWGSPAYDLLYMCSSVPFEFRNVAFHHYFNVFIDVLNKTGYKGKSPTFEQLQDSIRSYNFIDLFFTSTLAIFVLMDRDNMEMDLDKLIANDKSRRSLYDTPAYVEHVKKVVPGLLDSINVD